MFIFEFSSILVLLSVKSVLTISNGEPASTIRRRQAIGIAFIDNYFDINYPPFCTGALITHIFVLTTGNCPIEPTTVITIHSDPLTYGDFYYSVKTKSFGDEKNPDLRLQIIKLDRSVEFSQGIQPFSLPLNDEDRFDEDVDFYGYGSIWFKKPSDVPRNEVNPRYQREISNELNFINLPNQTMATCNDRLGHYDTGNVKLFCYGFTQRDKFDHRLMLDDNGAPMVGEKTRVVYGIAVPYMYQMTEEQWNTEPVPTYVIDVKNLVPQILATMKELIADH